MHAEKFCAGKTKEMGMDTSDPKANELHTGSPEKYGKEWRDKVGASVRQARERIGLTEGELANNTGVIIGTISKTELGKTTPSLATIYAIADELGLSIDELVGREVPRRANAEADATRLFALRDDLERRLEALEAEAPAALATSRRLEEIDAALHALLESDVLPRILRDRMRTALESSQQDHS